MLMKNLLIFINKCLNVVIVLKITGVILTEWEVRILKNLSNSYYSYDIKFVVDFLQMEITYFKASIKSAVQRPNTVKLCFHIYP